MTLNKYFYITRTNFVNSVAYIQDIIGSSAFIALIIFIFVNLWKVIYGSNEYINGFTIIMMLWYLVMTESIVTSQSRVLEEMGNEVINGNIANYLNKPYNYVLYKYFQSLGRSVVKFIVTFVIAGLVVYIFIGPININLITILPIILIVFLAITLNFLIMASLGVFAFWIEDAKSLDFVYSKIIFTIGGMLVPLEIFPKWLYNISIYLPFSYVAYYPAKLFVAFDYMLFFKVLIVELMWITVFAIIASMLYKICVKRISINGG